ncbi:MAG: arginine deiminase-related protein [Bacteroidota bacterium]
MVRPVRFGFNAETAVNNAFQVKGEQREVQENSLREFDSFVEKLRLNDIDVTVIDDTAEPHTPDSIFPNNWISFHEDGTVFLYPMFAANRRLERKPGVIATIKNKFDVQNIIDLSGYEASGKYLEGTGSMVLDRDKKLAYACLSPRTDKVVLAEFCNLSGYTPVVFRSVDGKGKEIYHTNVMMCAGDRYVVICLASIPDILERRFVIDTIAASGKQLFDISLDQMNHFAGNMLQVQNNIGLPFLVMSSQAFNSLTQNQINLLQSFNPIIHSSLNTIESNGGGSARCMMAEVHLAARKN